MKPDELDRLAIVAYRAYYQERHKIESYDLSQADTRTIAKWRRVARAVAKELAA